jgi:hypothetical protein
MRRRGLLFETAQALLHRAEHGWQAIASSAKKMLRGWRRGAEFALIGDAGTLGGMGCAG